MTIVIVSRCRDSKNRPENWENHHCSANMLQKILEKLFVLVKMIHDKIDDNCPEKCTPYENTLERKYITLSNKKLCKNKSGYYNCREATERYAERLVFSLNDWGCLSVCLSVYLSVSLFFCPHKWNSHQQKFSE